MGITLGRHRRVSDRSEARIERWWRRGVAALGTLSLALMGMLVAPHAASAAEPAGVTIEGASPTGAPAVGPSSGGTLLRLHPPVFAPPMVHTQNIYGTTYALSADGSSISYWQEGMAGPALFATLPGVRLIQLATSEYTTYALSTDGVVYGWGDGARGQLGTGGTADSAQPIPIPMPGNVRIGQIAANNQRGFALSTGGDLYSWGYFPCESQALLCFGHAELTPVQVPVASGVDLTQIYAAGESDWYGWDAAGNLYVWLSDDDHLTQSIVRAPAGVSFTIPVAPVNTLTITNVWFNVAYGRSATQVVPDSLSYGSWLATVPALDECGPVDVIVRYTVDGVQLQDTVAGGFFVNTPCAPTGVSAAAGDGQASVSFNPPPTVVGVPATTGYTVIATPTDGTGTPVRQSGTSSPIVVTGLANGTTYDVKVIASNANGDGPWSDQFGYQSGITVAPQGSLKITGVPDSVMYGDAGFTLGTSGGVGTGAVTYSVPAGNGVLAVDPTSGVVTVVGPGTVTIHASKAASGGAAAADASIPVTVGKRVVTVTADDQTMPAGGQAPMPTYTVSPPLVPGDTLGGGRLMYLLNPDGTYTIDENPVYPFSNPKYVITFVPGTMTVTPATVDQAPLSLAGVPSSVTYGDAGFTLGTSGGSGTGAVSYSVPAGNGVLSVDSSTGAVSVLGAGTVKVTATKAGDAQYSAASASVSVTVDKRAVTVTADNQSKVEGTIDPTLTYSVSPALIGSDTLTGSLTYTGTAPGTYPITQGTGLANPNYAITFVSGTMTITPATVDQAPLSITGVPATVTYGDAPFTLGPSGGSGDGAVTYSVPGDNGVLAVNPSTGAVTVLGTGTVTVTATKAASTGFFAATATSTVTVKPKAITVTANDATKVYGAGDPVLTYSVSPTLIGNDTLTGSLTYTGADVGAYPITADKPFANPNYTITFVPGTMTITPAAQAVLSISGVPGSVTYGDAGFTLGTSGGSGDGAVTFSAPQGNGVLTVDAATGAVSILGAGTVKVTATKAAAGNYYGATATATISVAPKAITVTANDVTKVYGAADPTLTFAVSPALVGSDTLTGSLTYTGTDVGTYPITADTPFANPNYTITFVSGTMTVTRKAVTVTASNQQKEFGADDPDLAYTVSPKLVGSDTLTGSLTYTGTDVGAYPITADTPFANPNYTITFVSGTMTITQTVAAQAAIDDVANLPETMVSNSDASLVATATNAIDALSPAERGQIPITVLDALHNAQTAAGEINHADPANGVTASGTALPWNVRLAVRPLTSADDGYTAVESGVADGRDLLALYSLSFTDTLTGLTWEPSADALGTVEPVTIELSRVAVAGRTDIAVLHQNADGTLQTLPATVTDGTVTFTGTTFSLYGVTATALIRTVTFEANGATQRSMAAQSANRTTALEANTFKYPAHSFAGWNTAADGSGTAYAPGALYSFKADVTLYAQWNKNGNGPKENDNSQQ